MVRVGAQRADAPHVQVAIEVCNALADVLCERGACLHHAPSVIEALCRLIVGCCYVVDLRRALIVVHEQVKLYRAGKRGLSVLAPHDPEHFAVLPHAVSVNEAKNNRQNGALEKL